MGQVRRFLPEDRAHQLVAIDVRLQREPTITRSWVFRMTNALRMTVSNRQETKEWKDIAAQIGIDPRQRREAAQKLVVGTVMADGLAQDLCGSAPPSSPAPPAPRCAAAGIDRSTLPRGSL